MGTTSVGLQSLFKIPVWSNNKYWTGNSFKYLSVVTTSVGLETTTFLESFVYVVSLLVQPLFEHGSQLVWFGLGVAHGCHVFT